MERASRRRLMLPSLINLALRTRCSWWSSLSMSLRTLSSATPISIKCYGIGSPKSTALKSQMARSSVSTKCSGRRLSITTMSGSFSRWAPNSAVEPNSIRRPQHDREGSCTQSCLMGTKATKGKATTTQCSMPPPPPSPSLDKMSNSMSFMSIT